MAEQELLPPLTQRDYEDILAELRWYGKTIAGGGPMIGFDKMGRQANDHWYKTTLPLLERLGAVYTTPTRATTSDYRRGWQPIESAPKEITHKSGSYEYGRHVLVYDGNVTTACWWQCRTKDGGIYGSNWIDNGANALNPSHWMPLPASPVR